MTDDDPLTDVRLRELPEDWAGASLITRRWIDAVVVGLGFCPWAAAVLDQSDGLSIQPCTGDATTRLEIVRTWLKTLATQDSPETLLLVVPVGLESFDQFLDFVDTSDNELRAMGLEGVLQIASFHPQYCFAGESFDDAANYTNRSPYPMLHILREDSITRSIGDGEFARSVPERNIKQAREIGNQRLSGILHDCIIGGRGANV